MIIYLHGLNSSSKSQKARHISRALAPTRVLAPDYPAHQPERAVSILLTLLERVVEQSGPPVIIGSSMGGFYGRWLITRVPCAHLFMINPAIQPWVQLRAYAGQPQETASGEGYVLTREILDQTRALAPSRPCANLDTPMTLLLDDGDEVIDQRSVAAAYRDCARLLIFPRGNHAFAHLDQSLDMIRETLTLCQESAAGLGPRLG